MNRLIEEIIREIPNRDQEELYTFIEKELKNYLISMDFEKCTNCQELRHCSSMRKCNVCDKRLCKECDNFIIKFYPRGNTIECRSHDRNEKF